MSVKSTETYKRSDANEIFKSWCEGYMEYRKKYQNAVRYYLGEDNYLLKGFERATEVYNQVGVENICNKELEHLLEVLADGTSIPCFESFRNFWVVDDKDYREEYHGNS